MQTIEERLADPRYRNWVKAGLCINIFKKGVEKFADDESRLLHQCIGAKVTGSRTRTAASPMSCNTCKNASIQFVQKSRRWTLNCPHNVCSRFLKELLRYHISPSSNKICWNNGDVNTWASDHWSVAKLYMNSGQSCNTGAASSDGSALLNLFLHCTWFCGGVGVTATIQNIRNCEDARERRNNIIHSGDMTCSDTDLTDFSDSLIRVLEDPMCLLQRQEAIDAVREIKKVREANCHISFSDANKVMEETLKDLNTRIETLDKAFTSIVEDGGEIDRKVELVETRTTSVETDTERQRQSLVKLSNNINELTRQMGSLAKNVMDTERRITSVETDQESLKENLATVTSVQDDQKTAMIALVPKVEDQAKKICAIEKRVTYVETLYERVIKETTEMQSDISGLKTEQLPVQLDAADNRDKDFNELQRKLVDYYRKHFSQVQVSPVDEGLTVPISKLYTEVVIVEEAAELDKHGHRERKERKLPCYKDIFYSCDKRRQNIFVLGSAGRGKTTWCGQLANMWCNILEEANREGAKRLEGDTSDKPLANGEYKVDGLKVSPDTNQSPVSALDKQECMRNFEYLFLIHLRQVGRSLSIYDAICTTILEDYSHLHETVKMVLKQHPDKVLVVCDGFDEYCAPTPLSRMHLCGCTVLTTTRPWKYDCIRSSKYKPDLVLQLKGLNDSGVQELTERILLHLDKDSAGNVKTRDCIESIKSAGLSETARIPLVLTYLVHLWQHSERNLSQSITVTMINLILWIIQEGEKNLRDIPNMKAMEDKWRRYELPGKLRNEPELQLYAGLLLSVARLAFDGLTSEEQEHSLIFRGKTLEKYFCESTEIDICLKLGLLSKSEVSLITRKATAITFYHKSVQEFFSAVWVAYEAKALKNLCKVCRNVDNVFDLGYVYTYLSGIDIKVAVKFSNHVAHVTASDARIVDWREDMFGASSNTAELLTDLNMRCLQESDQSVTEADSQFQITDVSASWRSPGNVECLLANIKHTVKHMFLSSVQLQTRQWKMLVESVTESTSLQTLALWDIGVCDDTIAELTSEYDAMRVPYNSVLESVTLLDIRAPLLSLLKCIKLAGQDYNDSPDMQNHATTGVLTFLGLGRVKLTMREWVILETIVSGTDSLQKLELEEISIQDQETARMFSVSSVSISPEDVTFEGVCATLLPLLTCVRRVTQQEGNNDGGPVSLDGLSSLKMRNVTMTKNEWHMLTTIVIESPTLQLLRLVNIDLSDRDTFEDLPENVNENILPHTVLQSVKLRRVRAPLLLLLTCFRSTLPPKTGNIDEQVPIAAGPLRYFGLRHVSITRQGWNLLMTIVKESSSLQNVDLKDIAIIEDIIKGACFRVQYVEVSEQSVALNRVPPPLLPILTNLRTTLDRIYALSPITKSAIVYLEVRNVSLTRYELDMLLMMTCELTSLQTVKYREIRNVDDVSASLYIEYVKILPQKVNLRGIHASLFLILASVRMITKVALMTKNTSRSKTSPFQKQNLTTMSLRDLAMTRNDCHELLKIVSEIPWQEIKFVDLRIDNQNTSAGMFDVSSPEHYAHNEGFFNTVPQHVTFIRVSDLLLPLLKCIMTASATKLDNLSGDNECVNRPVPATIPLLTYLKLKYVKVSGSALNALVKAVNGPSLETLCLECITFEEEINLNDCWKLLLHGIRLSQSMKEFTIDRALEDITTLPPDKWKRNMASINSTVVTYQRINTTP